MTSSALPPRMSAKAEQILAGAIPEFLHHGYAGTSMDRVAKAAGVSKQTLYSHFSDKDGLFAAMVERVASQKLAVIWSQPLTGEPELVLRSLADRLLDHAMNDEDYLGFVRLLVAESRQHPELAQMLLRCLAKPAIEVLKTYLRSQPNLPIADPEVAARIFVGSLIHHGFTQKLLGGDVVMPLASQRLVDGLILATLGPASAEGDR